jgi:hypothetical protein
MKKIQAEITVRFVAAMLVIVAVVTLSALAMHAPTQNQNPLVLKRIQTDKATLFCSNNGGIAGGWFVEQVLPGTSESKAATENLKSIAAAL